MTEDTRSAIEQIQSKAQAYHGKELSPDEMATEFAKWPIDERAQVIDRLDADLKDSEHSVEKAARLFGYDRALRRTHEALRKVGR